MTNIIMIIFNKKVSIGINILFLVLTFGILLMEDIQRKIHILMMSMVKDGLMILIVILMVLIITMMEILMKIILDIIDLF